MEVGYIWVGKRSYVCSDNPSENIRRFKMSRSDKSLFSSVELWYGTAYDVDGNDYDIGEAFDYHAVHENTQGRYITVILGELPIFAREHNSKEPRSKLRGFNPIV